MNVYAVGMAISIAVYSIVSLSLRKRTKTVEDFYIAGRHAGVLLISCSIIASMVSTGTFMADAGVYFTGGFVPEIIMISILVTGYIVGSVFWGRCLRRSNAVTVPEFFGIRFCSDRLRKVAAITACITMIVYLISVTQGVCTLVNLVTHFKYEYCIVIVLVTAAIIVCVSGSRGVLITDTIMSLFFVFIMIMAMVYIVRSQGGWFHSIKMIKELDPDLLSWRGKEGVVGYGAGIDNIIWGIVYGIVWMSVAMVAPWQCSRYLMAEDEHVVVRSSVFSGFMFWGLAFIMGMSAVFLNLASPDIADNTHIMIWAAMHSMPTIVGVLLTTGILAAGISSLTTFLSLVGASVANDLLKVEEREKIKIGKVAIIIAVLIVLIVCETNPPALFIILNFGGAIITSSWLPVVIICVFDRNANRISAICGMATGFIVCFLSKLLFPMVGIELPIWMDPAILGITGNFFIIFIMNHFFIPTVEEKESYDKLHMLPKEYKNGKKMEENMFYLKLYMAVSVLVGVILLIFWAIPVAMK